MTYLESSVRKGLLFASYGRLNVDPSGDADWTDYVDFWMIGGLPLATACCPVFVGTLGMWGSEKQSMVFRSTAEAEFRALALGVYELLWFHFMLK